MCFTALFDGLGAGWRWMRWKVVKIFQEIELRAWRELTERRASAKSAPRLLFVRTCPLGPVLWESQAGGQ